MKKRIIATLLVTTVLNAADEISQINSLVTKVKKLQSDYQVCQQHLEKYIHKASQPQSLQLQNCQRELQDTKQKVALLEQELDSSVKEESSCEESETFKTKIATLQTTIEELRQQNKAYKKKIASLEVELAHQQELSKTQDKIVQKETPYRIYFITPSTYRTSKDAPIYDGINGKVIDKWEKGTSFTSYINSDHWIKITGYFVDRKWRKAQKDLWIKKSDAFKR